MLLPSFARATHAFCSCMQKNQMTKVLLKVLEQIGEQEGDLKKKKKKKRAWGGRWLPEKETFQTLKENGTLW